MGWIARFLGAFLLVAAACGMLPAGPAAAGEADTGAVMVFQINAVRAQFGLPAVHLDGRLVQAARAHTEALAARGTLTHGNFAGRMAALGPGYGYTAENLAGGMQSPAAVVAAWMRSPAHRANLLQPSVTVIGLAHSKTIWTLILAQRV
jgi:uncharacterized protein YkwD